MATNSSSAQQRRPKARAKPRPAAKKGAALSSREAAPRVSETETAVNEAAGKNVSSADQLAAQIVRGLYDGRFVAGQKLVEPELTRRFDVGRGTVREALRRLAAEGYVTYSLNKGASIRSLSRTDVLDLLDVLEALCGLAARRAAETLSSSEDVNALRAMMSSLTAFAAAGDSFEFGRMRDRFYRLLVQISQNQELARLLSMVNVHLVRVQTRSSGGPASQKERLDDYQKIIDALIARDGVRAERVMRQHIRNAARAIDQLPDHEFD